MLKFLRISNLYPEVLNNFKRKYPDINKKNYNEILSLLHLERYSVSNFYSIYLNKLNYKCTEIISNADFLQKKWADQYCKVSYKNSNFLFKQINYYKPNILFIGNSHLCNKDFIEKLREIKSIKLILAFHCAPFNNVVYNNLKNVDAAITCTLGYQKKINNFIKKKVLFLPHAYYKQKFIEKNNERDIDITFIGSIFFDNALHIDRINLVYKLLKNFNNTYISINFSNFFLIRYILFVLEIFFSSNLLRNTSLIYKLLFIFLFAKKPVFGKEMYQIFQRTKIVINMHIKDTDYAGNMRIFEATGCGCLLLTDKKKGYESFFKLNKEIIVFNNVNDLIYKCRFFLKNNKLLIKIAKRGFQKTINKHNYFLRAKKIDLFVKNFLIRNKILKNNKNNKDTIKSTN